MPAGSSSSRRLWSRPWSNARRAFGYDPDDMKPRGHRRRPLPLDFRVGEWLVQPGLDRITREGATVHLRARLMDVLARLADHAGEVVLKEDLIASVWEQQFLAESVLTRTITELRHALGDDPRAPRYIETITKRGYRLVAAVESVEPHRAGPAGEATFVLSYAGRRIALPQGESLIGRDADVPVRIDSMQVSRHHARIVVSAGRAWIEDLGSKNGTHVDGRAVVGRVELVDGARIEIGRATLVAHELGRNGTTETDPPASKHSM